METFADDTYMIFTTFIVHTALMTLLCSVLLSQLHHTPRHTAVFSAETIKKLLLENRFVLRHWDDSARELNDIQTKTLMSALMNRFQLIQGPPGNACECVHLWSVF